MGRLFAQPTPGVADQEGGRAPAGVERSDTPPPSDKTRAQGAWAARADEHARLAAPVAAQTIPHLLIHAGVRAGRRVLDLGCGAGFATGAAYAMGADALGVDFSPTMIAAARERFPKVAFQIGAAEALDARADTYDAVLCNFAMAQFSAPERAFKEAFRALKPGGRLVWSAWTAADDNPFMTAARAAYGVTADGVFRFASESAAERAAGAAGFALVASDRVGLALTAPEADAAALARMLDPTVDAAAESVGSAALDGAMKRFVKNHAVEARAVATVYVAQKPGSAVRFDDLVAPDAAAERKQGFGVVRRLLGRR